VTADVKSGVTPQASGDRISTRPIIGVAAVLVGTINSVLADRLMLNALPDLRGALGIGIDQAAWIPSALNAAQMFMGPMSIALAAVFGHRRVLLYSCFVYIFSSALAPFILDWHTLIAVQVIRGLSSGTFYPLTLSLVVRNLPKQWITFGIAAYAMDVLGSNHLAFPLYAFYHEYLSWTWIFWNSVIFTSVMVLCIIRGIPKQAPMPDFHKMRFRDFIYASAGLTFLYIGLDQGERCDWFNSGLINGLFVAGTILLILAAYRRFRSPNPLIDLHILISRNVGLLSYCLTVYRVSLLATFSLIPSFLIGLQSYRPLEAAPLALESGIAAVLVAPIIAVAVKKYDARLIAAVGLAILSLGLLGQAHLLSTWLRQDFLDWQIIIAAAHPIVFIPLVAIQLYSDQRPGQEPSRVFLYTTGVYFQIIRLFGTEAGNSVMQRFLLTRNHFWRTILVSHVNGTWQTDERLATLSRAMVSNAPGLSPANQRAVRLLTENVLRQAQTLSIADGFMILGCFVVSAVFVTAFLRPVTLPGALCEKL
jgi:DHA2 family multidrug resistance protein